MLLLKGEDSSRFLSLDIEFREFGGIREFGGK